MAWVYPVVSGIVSLLGSMYGANKAKQNAKNLQNQQQPLLDQQLANLQFLQPFGQRLVGQGSGLLGSAANQYQSMLSNPQQWAAPGINDISQSYLGSMNASRGLYPRGGMTSSQSQQLPYQQQGQINNMLFNTRQAGLQGVQGVGANMTGLGMGALGQSSGLTNNMLNYGLNAQNQMFGQGMQIGQGISSLIGPMMQYMIMNRGQGNAATTNAALPTWGNTNSYPFAYNPSTVAPGGPRSGQAAGGTGFFQKGSAANTYGSGSNNLYGSG